MAGGLQPANRDPPSIYLRFCAFLGDALGRPPTLADLDADAIAAYERHLEHEAAAEAVRRALHTACARDDVARARA